MQIPDPLTLLAEDFPGWHVWRGRDGRGTDKGWYATRRRRLAASELYAGLTARLGAVDVASLRGLLEQQQVIEKRFYPLNDAGSAALTGGLA